jgi:hypothetical protein
MRVASSQAVYSKLHIFIFLTAQSSYDLLFQRKLELRYADQ